MHVKGSFNEALFYEFIDHTKRVIKESNIPFELYFDHAQEGSFGVKLAKAVSLVFDKGFQKVIVIGNDCPGLTSNILQSAKRNLENNDLVIGPDRRGGVYLLGISKNIFRENIFAELPWQQANLFSLIKLKTLDIGISFVQLKTLTDVNFEKDLLSILNEVRPLNKLHLLIKSLVLIFYNQVTYQFQFSREQFVSGLRAPPVLS